MNFCYMDNNQQKLDDEDQEPKVYKFRWFTAILVALIVVILRLLMNSFGVVNNVYVTYFNLTYVEVDWFTLSPIPGDILCSLVLSLLIYLKRTGFRTQVLLMTGCEIITCICLICAYLKPTFYPIIYCGQFILGFALSMSTTAYTTFAINWFPKRELGTALSIRPTSLGIGSLLAYIIPSRLFISINSNATNSSIIGEKIKERWLVETKIRFLMFSVPILVLCVVLLVVKFFCVSENPPQPADIQSNVKEIKEKKGFQTEVSIETIKEFFYEVIKILKNRTEIIVVVLISIKVGINFIMILLLSEMVRHLNSEKLDASKSNQLASYILMICNVGWTLGGFSSGVVYDKLKRPTFQIHVCSFVGLIALIGLLLGYHFKSIIMLICFGGLSGLMIGFTDTVYLLILFQHNEVGNEALVANLVKLQTYLGVLLIEVSARLVINSWGAIAIFIYMISLWSLLIVLSCFLKPKRYNSEENSSLIQRDK